MRNPGLPKVAVFGLRSAEELPPAEQLRSHEAASYEADDFAISVFPDDSELERVLAELDPQAIVSIGVMDHFARLMAAPYYVRRRWIHRDRAEELRGRDILHCFLIAAMPGPADPLAPRKLSVFTPVFNTGRELLLRTWASLQRQTYADWEWVLADDHSDDPGTVQTLQELAGDFRVSLHRRKAPSGNIGELKGYLCGVASGDVLVELDHDDVLAPHTLGWLARALREHPECGVVHTNWAEQFEGTDRFNDYGADYAFGYGRAHWETHPADYATGGATSTPYFVQDALRLNAKTIRHIVGVPNHVRAWTREAYDAAGGYSTLHVADDYELLVRLFLVTRFCLVPTLGYVQFYNASIGNTQDRRRKEIQRIVRFVADHYDRRIHDRLLELGVDDFVWDEAVGRADMTRPNPEVESHCTVVQDVSG